MEKKKAWVPVWMKVVLGILLGILAGFSALVAMVWIQKAQADERNTLPVMAGYRYCPVGAGNFGTKYPEGALLLVEPEDTYPNGAELLIIGKDVAQQDQLLSGRYLLVRKTDYEDMKTTGTLLGNGDEVVFIRPQIMGRVEYIIPALGSLYLLLFSSWGVLAVIGVPALLALVWAGAMGIVRLRRKGRADFEEFSSGDEETEPASEEQSSPKEHPRKKSARPSQDKALLKEHDKLDLFEEESSPVMPDTVSAGEAGHHAFAETAEQDENLPAADLDVSPAEETRVILLRRPAGPAAGSLHDTIEFDPQKFRGREGEKVSDSASPASDLPGSDQSAPEAVAIYPKDGQKAETFSPGYLNQNLEGSLEELRSALQSSDKSGESSPEDTRAEKKETAHRPPSFDPDKAVDEIRRGNALYGLKISFGTEKTLQHTAKPEIPDEKVPSDTQPEKNENLPETSSAGGKQPDIPLLSADEILRLYRQNREAASKAQAGSHDYHNRNDTDSPEHR